MGFWNTVGNLAKAGGKAALEGAKDICEKSQALKSEMQSKSDNQLFQNVKRNSGRTTLEGTASFGEQKIEATLQTKSKTQFASRAQPCM